MLCVYQQPQLATTQSIVPPLYFDPVVKPSWCRNERKEKIWQGKAGYREVEQKNNVLMKISLERPQTWVEVTSRHSSADQDANHEREPEAERDRLEVAEGVAAKDDLEIHSIY